MPVQLRTIVGKVPLEVELMIRDLVEAVNRLEAIVAALQAQVKKE